MGRRRSSQQGRSVLVSNSTTDGGVAAIGALKRSGWSVDGMDTRRLPLGVKSRHLRAEHPVPSSSDETYREAIRELVDRTRPDVFLPLGAASTRAACELGDRLKTRCNVPPLAAFQAAQDKMTCTAACRQLGIPVPSVYSQDEAAALLLRGNEQVVVKPARSAGAAVGVSYVRDAESLSGVCDAVAGEFGELQLQEYIPGDASAMRTLVVLYSPESRLVAAFTAGKVRQSPCTGGVMVIGRSTAESALIDLVRPLFHQWRWRGPAEVEFKLDPRDGRHKVIEVNPRFPGYLRFPGRVGLNLADLTARLALGAEPVEEITFPGYQVGQSYLNLGIFGSSVAASLRAGGRGEALRLAAGQLRGTGPHLLDVLSDPLPAIGRMVFDARRSR